MGDQPSPDLHPPTFCQVNTYEIRCEDALRDEHEVKDDPAAFEARESVGVEPRGELRGVDEEVDMLQVRNARGVLTLMGSFFGPNI